jgi:hypothetical protein
VHFPGDILISFRGKIVSHLTKLHMTADLLSAHLQNFLTEGVDFRLALSLEGEETAASIVVILITSRAQAESVTLRRSPVVTKLNSNFLIRWLAEDIPASEP